MKSTFIILLLIVISLNVYALPANKIVSCSYQNTSGSLQLVRAEELPYNLGIGSWAAASFLHDSYSGFCSEVYNDNDEDFNIVIYEIIAPGDLKVWIEDKACNADSEGGLLIRDFKKSIKVGEHFSGKVKYGARTTFSTTIYIKNKNETRSAKEICLSLNHNALLL